ncbi:hypothetical protein [Adhaeretor mobilis]|nr:hypothetical protein [Adhaeretor mobilis]
MEELPNDVDALKQFIAEQHWQHTSEIEHLKEEQQAAIDEAVKAAVAAILRRYYGPPSEKFDPRQLWLFGQRIDRANLDQASVEDESGEPLVTRRVKNRD